jgi:hypothetical protein
MKKTVHSLFFALILCGCQSSTQAPSLMIGASDTAMRWDSTSSSLRHFTGGFLTSDGLTLFYQGWQPLDSVKAVVCLVHGVAEHSGRYARYAASLCNAKFAVISFDLRGHGRVIFTSFTTSRDTKWLWPMLLPGWILACDEDVRIQAGYC